jgi:hypothetical protein
MQRLVVNGSEWTIENLPDSWGKLLEQVDVTAAAGGEVVTAVRFDGIDQPAFRHALLGECPLDHVNSIEIETAARRELIEAALEHGSTSADVLTVAAREVGTMFRRGDLADAHQRLVQFAEGIRTLVVLIGVVEAALGVSAEELDANGRSISDEVTDLMAQLEDVTAAQQAHDWLAIADILEYAFPPMLDYWRSLLEGLRSGV